MTYKEKVKYLCGYRDIIETAKDYRRQIIELREMQLPSSPLLDGMPKNPSRDDVMANYAARHTELSNEYDKVIGKLINYHRSIDAIDNWLERRVLKLYYIHEKKIWEIAQETNYSERHIKRIKKNAINHLIIRL